MQQPTLPTHTAAVPGASAAESNEASGDAPPKQVAMALERLGQASRLIADIRIGGDRLLEALFVAAQRPHSSEPLHLILKEEASMRQHLRDLRSVGRQLEDSGVLNDSLRLRSNSWGLHMPLICPDGAVVAYAWKRQLAGQAGASAVDRTRLALKAFNDQKRRFFPHLDTNCGKEGVTKKLCGPPSSDQEETCELKTVSEVLTHLKKEVPNVITFSYQRLDWLMRATSLPSSTSENSIEISKENTFQSTRTLRQGSSDDVVPDKVAIIELLIPSVFRAIVSVSPAGSLDPDAVAFFSPDEGGSYVHARGFSVHHAFRHITEHAAMALQHFTGVGPKTALLSLLFWVCSYQTLFSKVCSKCSRLLSMDKESAVLLPPVNHPYRKFCAGNFLSKSASKEDQSVDSTQGFHIDCFSEEA
ncbi:mediator of RNA polymerase II transcription subunit 27-like [Solanum dulcamara]|uniref:mediator of RNA polymerase II transcription subunit 27-like n=1 Tax=Solanum dulcamara TaxID=45834 RepID=UPI002485E603|nr:mediator of RNA polymerase II transcription subunit 27-like [Solanum dulcamara]XP_055817853.1 mediator of RNA polymerase II transcription subunit 27-like [Solanum dulcamara]XP_055817854.1 mediator of RNA polymerase II transcription subunit 27-like [Solanum dulcamara]XP_055817856.1 mediator of RNA polymerase II transcription subunit 27-like [Solanum dulcamara]XP_055817857.1 mediator of RNA polymerase II transcription subunit 27-like [Solanum dulcamara]